KPMELPIQFFLDFAWDTKKWNAGNIAGYTREWAEQIFGKQYASEIAGILSAYTKYNSRRKPELLAPDTYSLINYREAETIETEYSRLAQKAESIYRKIPAAYRDAYYQLVLYPVKACANLNKLYVTSGKNRLYAEQGRASANDEGDNVKKYFKADSLLSKYYNTVMSRGKWDHMMDQTHIGYTYWQQPEKNVRPEIKYIQLSDVAEPGLAIEGAEAWWPRETAEAVLPEFNSLLNQSHYFELFNRGVKPFTFSILSPVPWIKISGQNGIVKKQERLWVQVNWKTAPAGIHKFPIIISVTGKQPLAVFVVVKNYKSSKETQFKGFVETNGYVSMEAAHYSLAVSQPSTGWMLIPDIGRTGSGMTTKPVTAARQNPGPQTPRLEYDLLVFDTGKIQVQTYFSPTLNFNGSELQYAISIDDEKPQILNLHADQSRHSWEQWVANNVITDTAEFDIRKPGAHTMKYWMIDPGIILQKIVIGLSRVNPSYLGPPETRVR
ncbi:MAG TPA: glycosyl hydrolase 115 family protein, partial [Puia sp.]